MEKGIKPDIPKSLLRLPVFNRASHVYYVKFLGPTVIHRNNVYLKIHITPKHTAILIALAMRFNAPNKVIPITELYRNFWPGSRNPAQQLSRTLGQIRRKMKIPPHCIVTVSQQASKRLINRGLYITTDYDDCVRAFSEARAFARINEWSLAWARYVDAFKLVRGAPCKKMYDHWSELVRRMILNRIEAELDHFLTLQRKFPARAKVRSIQNRISRIIASG
jgi:hypothetical protein